MNSKSKIKIKVTKVKKNNNNQSIIPTKWVLPNRRDFLDWVSNTFKKYRLTGDEVIGNTKEFKPFKVQKFLRDLMGMSSPYRGILLYHTVGGGKTCTSISIAESLKDERNIVVMLPASLRSNFINQGLLYCGDRDYRLNPDLIKEKYSFVSYNASNTIDQLRKLGTLDNKVIIIEEVHNLVSMMVGGLFGTSKQGKKIYEMLINSQNSKIIALTGTPLINDPIELGVLYNVLSGYLEVIYYRIINVADKYGETWDFKEVIEELLRNEYIDNIELNKKNKSIEFSLKIKHYDNDFQDIIRLIEKTFKEMGIEIKYLERKDYELFPIQDDGELFYNYFVDISSEGGDRLKNGDLFQKRIIGLTSYYEPPLKSLPKLIMHDITKVPMSSYQYKIYELLREKERKTEKGQSGAVGPRKKKKGTSQVKSVFRVFSREACNFVFPEEIPRPYKDPKFIVSLKKNNKKNNVDLNKVINAEEHTNNEGKMTQEYKNRINKALTKLVENGDEYFKNELDILSPKMKTILDNVNKSKGKIFIYSSFRVLEGVEIFTKVLDFNGYAKYGTNNKLPKYAIYSGMEDEQYRTDILKKYNSIDNLYGEDLKIVLATSAGAEGLDLKCVRQIHIMDPYWNQTRVNQVVGRGVRTNSHKDLPPEERNVEVFQYLSVFNEQNAKISKEAYSTDEYINILSYKKQMIIDDLLTVVKSSSVDCVLNSAGMRSDYRCFTFGTGATGISYNPKLTSDILSTGFISGTKKVEKKLVKGIYYGKDVYLFDKNKKFYKFIDKNKVNKNYHNIDIKKSKPVLVEFDTGIIYDFKTKAKIAIYKNNTLIKMK